MKRTDDTASQQALAEYLKSEEGGYLDARVLPDGSVAGLINLITTRAIVLGCNRDGWETRFCFIDRSMATARFAELESEDDIPTGYTARRPQIVLDPQAAWPFPPRPGADEK